MKICLILDIKGLSIPDMFGARGRFARALSADPQGAICGAEQWPKFLLNTRSPGHSSTKGGDDRQRVFLLHVSSSGTANYQKYFKN